MDSGQERSERWSSRSTEEISAAWIDYQSRQHAADEQAGEDPAWWAVEALIDLTLDDPLRVLEICFHIARTSDAPRVLMMLGAGPLEDLLSGDLAFFDAIAFETKSNANLVKALGSTWQSSIPDDVWQRLIGSA